MKERIQKVMFLSQEPYVTVGSLADQIAFPLNAVEAALAGMVQHTYLFIFFF